VLQAFQGREDILSRIESYLSSPAVDPLVLYGLSGSGKTSVLAKSASLVHRCLSDLSPVVIVRFLGTLFCDSLSFAAVDLAVFFYLGHYK